MRESLIFSWYLSIIPYFTASFATSGRSQFHQQRGAYLTCLVLFSPLTHLGYSIREISSRYFLFCLRTRFAVHSFSPPLRSIPEKEDFIRDNLRTRQAASKATDLTCQRRLPPSFIAIRFPTDTPASILRSSVIIYAALHCA